MKIGILIVVIWTFLMVPAQASDIAGPKDRYLCTVDKASGFIYNSRLKAWDNATFRADSKYLIAVSRNPESAFQITKVGDNFPSGSCVKGFNEAGYLICGTLTFGGEFRFNKANGRFVTFPQLDITQSVLD